MSRFTGFLKSLYLFSAPIAWVRIFKSNTRLFIYKQNKLLVSFESTKKKSGNHSQSAITDL